MGLKGRRLNWLTTCVGLAVAYTGITPALVGRRVKSRARIELIADNYDHDTLLSRRVSSSAKARSKKYYEQAKIFNNFRVVLECAAQRVCFNIDCRDSFRICYHPLSVLWASVRFQVGEAVDVVLRCVTTTLCATYKSDLTILERAELVLHT